MLPAPSRPAARDWCRSSDNRLARRGFTLVELLVVIGIIALLISILLPALNRARAQANLVKCATQMREIGNAFRYYASENHSYYPPAKLLPADDAANKYSLGSYDFTHTTPAFWINFLNKYVTKNGSGNALRSAAEANDVKNRSVLWGCPSFEAYTGTNVGANTTAGFNVVQTGYGMNAYPFYTLTSSPTAQAYAAVPLTDDSNGQWSMANPSRCFFKSEVWNRHGAERMLIGESKYFQCWTAAPTPPIRNAVQPTYVSWQLGSLQDVATDGQSYINYWRHGKLPKNESTTSTDAKFDVNKGQLNYNILYCDGHVATATDAKAGYLAFRMKYPG